MATGEKVLTIADERDVEVEAWLAPGDLINLSDGAAVSLYPGARPLNPVHARLRYLAHEAVSRPDGTQAWRLRATLEGADPEARIGQKGTARIAGGRVPLAYWLLRRPFATLRPWTGL